MANPQPALLALRPALTLDELTRPSEQQTERLLDLAGRVYKNKPWKKLEEEEIFVVRNLSDDTQLFVGAIGGAGEQAGIIIYRGAEAYFGLLDFLERASQLPAIPQMAEGLDAADELLAMLADALGQANFDPMELMQLPQLQLMFEPSDQLEEPDEEWITRHKYKATGAGFPTFRSVSSGFLPWWISADEADLMIVALEQLLEIVGRKKFSSDLLEIKEIEKEENFALDLFARVPTTDEKGAVSWTDARVVVSPNDAEQRIDFAPDAEHIKRIREMPASRDILEVALVSLPTTLGGADVRPYFPLLLMLGDKGEVAGMENLPCGYGDASIPVIVDGVIKMLAERKKRPKTLRFSTPDLDVLNVIGGQLGITIEEVEELPTLAPAIDSLLEHMENVDLDDLDEDDSEDFEAGAPPNYLH